jgi:hypothetical protein
MSLKVILRYLFTSLYLFDVGFKLFDLSKGFLLVPLGLVLLLDQLKDLTALLGAYHKSVSFLDCFLGDFFGCQCGGLGAFGSLNWNV